MHLRSQSVFLLTIAATSCAHVLPKMDIPLTSSAALCAGTTLGQGEMCLPIAKLEHLLRDADMSVLQARGTSSGTNGAMTLWMEFPKDHVTLKAKWKEAAQGGSAMNNEPRKELAAYELQKLFLDPEEYVVPPTVSRCIPLGLYEIQIRPTKATFPGTACAFGVLSYWLSGIEMLSGFDAKRFETDLKYRKAISNLNVFTYLFDHRDTRPANFAISKSHDFPRAFAIDNGLALNGITNPRTTFRHEWNRIAVPKLPHRTVERLRAITRAQLDALATVAELAIDGQQMDSIARTASFEDHDGVRRKGNVIQLGLTNKEIDQIAERLRALIERVDSKQLEVY